MIWGVGPGFQRVVRVAARRFSPVFRTCGFSVLHGFRGTKAVCPARRGAILACRPDSRSVIILSMSKYRLDESFEIIGGFWVFGQEDKKFTGTLSSSKGLVEIQTSPTYSELDDAALRASMLELSGTTDIQQISAICGFTTDKRCTLLNSVILDGGGLTDFSSRRQVQRKLYR